MASITAENYLKAIYSIQLESGETLVSTGKIAAALNVTPGTVTSMMKTFADAGLLSYTPYSGVELRENGLEIARRVLRRHRVVELFLVEILGMDWSEVHHDAEVLEHAVSDGIIERMDEMLGRPRFDPHGDPIPTAQGTMVETNFPSLLTCPLETPLRIARVLDQNAGFLRFLEEHRLMPGNELTVRERHEEIDTIRLETPGGATFNLGFRAAGKILVEPQGEQPGPPPRESS